MTFIIDNDNNITAFAELPEGANSDAFASEKELAKLTAEWPAARLVEVWNNFAGVAPFDDLRPVKKFTDRKAALARIWNAVQRLAANLAPQATHVAPKKGKARKAAAKKTERATARDGSKKAEVLALLRRTKGATLAEIMKATDWQAHSVRGFISDAVRKKMGLKVESTHRDDGERVYKI